MQDLNTHAQSHKSSNTHMKGLYRDTRHFDHEPSLGTYSPPLVFPLPCLKQRDLPHFSRWLKGLIFREKRGNFWPCIFHISSFLSSPFSKSVPVYLHLTSKNGIFPSIFLQSSRSLLKSPRRSHLKLWLHVCKHQAQKWKLKKAKKKKNPPLTRPRSSSVCPDRDLFESQPRREVSLCRMFKLPMWRLKKKKKN